ncbi:MAG: ABC transporter permease [Acetobacteraceae bacterium]
MLRITVSRLAGAVPTLLLVSLITFALLHLIPGDPAVVIAGLSATPEEVAQIRADLGLDQPLMTQLIHWYVDLLHGHMGHSLLLGQDVLQAVLQRLPVTLALSAYALVLTLLVGIAGGVVAALRQNTVVDQAAMVFSMLGISMPSFFFGPLLVLLFAVHLGWLPTAATSTSAPTRGSGSAPPRCRRCRWRCCKSGCSRASPAPPCSRCCAGLRAHRARQGPAGLDGGRQARAGECDDPDQHRGGHLGQPAGVRLGGGGDDLLRPRDRPVADAGGAEPRLPAGAGRVAAAHHLPGAGEYRRGRALRSPGPAGAPWMTTPPPARCGTRWGGCCGIGCS